MAEILSPHMLKTLKQCSEKYYFKYIKKISMPSNNEIYTTGQNIHALASYYLKKQNIDKMESSLDVKELEIWNYLKNIKYFNYEVINTEYNLFFKSGKHFFGGRLDALVKSENRYYILDYKTGAAPKDAKYDFQTMIYLLAVMNFFKTYEITFVYIDLKNKKEVCIDLTEGLVQEYTQKLNEIAAKTDRTDFPASGKECKTCEYGIICYDKKLPD